MTSAKLIGTIWLRRFATECVATPSETRENVMEEALLIYQLGARHRTSKELNQVPVF